MFTDVRTHYDMLIDEENDPVNDPAPLKEYMDRWDGQPFIDALQLDETKTVLEIGVGTGRLAVQVVPFCRRFTGIDISPKTIGRAKQHLAEYKNVNLICGDYFAYGFGTKFDVIYSSLTWMHFRDKQTAVKKTAGLLNHTGRFVLSVSKDREDTIDYGTRAIRVFPDDPGAIRSQIKNSGLLLLETIETENATVFVSGKRLITPLSTNL